MEVVRGSRFSFGIGDKGNAASLLLPPCSSGFLEDSLDHKLVAEALYLFHVSQAFWLRSIAADSLLLEAMLTLSLVIGSRKNFHDKSFFIFDPYSLSVVSYNLQVN